MSKWINTNTTLPPDGLLVATKVQDGYEVFDEQKLIRKGNLWFTPDLKNYVYYTPTHWKSL